MQKENYMNPPWQVTEPHNYNPLGLPAPDVQQQRDALGNLGVFASGRSVSAQRYGLVDNPQHLPAIGPSFGLPGRYTAPTDRPRWYPQDGLTKAEPSTVTPPTSFKATNKNFNPDGEDGVTVGEIEPVHPVPCSIYDSQGTGICNDEKQMAPSKGVVEQIMTMGAMAITPTKPIGGR